MRIGPDWSTCSHMITKVGKQSRDHDDWLSDRYGIRNTGMTTESMKDGWNTELVVMESY